MRIRRPRVRKGQLDVSLSRSEFARRFQANFFDPRFETVAEKINATFGDFEKFKEQFVASGVGQFGSGWVWLVASGGKVEIVKTANADTPLTEGKTPLLVCDVWEHAYYLDYQNRRADFVKVFIEKLANWTFANEQLAKAK